MDSQEAFQTLLRSKKFQNWKKNYPQNYLSHFYCQLNYCQLNSSFKQASPWEIGFYNKKSDKLTLFILNQNNQNNSNNLQIELRPEESPFKKEGPVEELNLNSLKTTLKQAFELFQQVKEQHYPKELLLNGFLIIQHWQNQALYNLSFATKSLNILNLKINALNQKIISHQLISFIQ